MRGRLCLLSFIVASASVQILPKLSLGVVIAGYLAVTTTVVGIGLVAFPANTTLRFNSRRLLLTAFLMLLSSLIGFTSTLYRADARLNDQLSARDENKVSRVTVRVNSLVRISGNGRRFEGEVLSSQPEGIPKHVLINWYQGRYAGPYAARNTQTIEFPDIIPGQIWSMALTLKQVHGLRNPHGFDYEGHLFAQGIRTTGNVRGQPQLIDDQPFHSLRVFSERVRHHVRASMQTHIEGMRYGAVLLALAIGDQASVEAHDWRTFNLTGITHLVSISGTHVTLIASLGGLLVYRFWRRWQWRNKGLAERCPAQIVACLVAVIIAWCYCLLAGWGIPAQRTFLMLAIVAGARLMRLSITASRLLILAAFIVVAFDPWAILASGFWLSFSAVCILLTSAGWWGQPSQLLQIIPGSPAKPLSSAGSPPFRPTKKRRFYQASQLQLAITAGITPFLAYWFHEISIISPLVNAYAIPLIGLFVTPMALVLAALAVLPYADIVAKWAAIVAHEPLYWSMRASEWLATLPAASLPVAAAPSILFIIAMVGVCIAILPYGPASRQLAWLLLLPLLLWKPARPSYGHWELTALDVGQGGALVIHTHSHTLLFDTGLRVSPTSDSGERIITPYLKAKGVQAIDALIVSHADLDHVGGVRSLLQNFPVGQSFTPFNLEGFLQREARLLGQSGQLPPLPLAMNYCYQGYAWEVDGVHFEFLWPKPENLIGRRRDTSRERNDYGCVLRLQGQTHSALLTGDISAAQEAQLLAHGLEASDVVLAAHHGSKTSSSHKFVQSVRARHAIAQLAAWNRYGHPAPVVEARWQAFGTQFWRNDHHGAISIVSTPKQLSVQAERIKRARYWQARPSN